MTIAEEEVKLVKLDLGCGKAPVSEGCIGVDKVKYDNVTVVTDLRKPWPWEDDSIDEVVSRNLINYLSPVDRIFFANELYRVLKVGSKALLGTPHWACNKAYGDVYVQMPPVSEEWFFYLRKEWRETNAYWAKDYHCDFDFTCGYSMHPHLFTRNQDYQQHAISFWKEAAQDIVATLTKRKP